MGLKVRANYFGATTRVDTRKLNPASRLLVELTGQPVQANKAIVGRNAFAHESGIHQHGMLRHPATYEIMRPQDVGVDATRLVLGKHSGRAALRKRLEALGHSPDEVALDDIFARFKVLADQRHEIHDRDLEMLARGRVGRTLRGVAA
jgi:2-isopropylmalate synthase